jgi:hypothetical protein
VFDYLLFEKKRKFVKEKKTPEIIDVFFPRKEMPKL